MSESKQLFSDCMQVLATTVTAGDGQSLGTVGLEIIDFDYGDWKNK